jgi:hypothetical protein
VRGRITLGGARIDLDDWVEARTQTFFLPLRRKVVVTVRHDQANPAVDTTAAVVNSLGS